MTSSSQAHSKHSTGAHGAHRRAPSMLAQTPPSRYEPYLDGLFTYCLSVLCDHGTATEVLADVLAVAERQAGRGPADEGQRRAWLYALARWACLRKLAELRRARQGAHGTHRAPAHHRSHRGVVGHPDAPASEGAVTPDGADATARAQHRELALLAWPEAAGTSPEQREALELAVRHRLSATEVAVVLGMPLQNTRDLLAGAACEVERTRAALAVVESGGCPVVARFTGDNEVLLSTALRGELVRHVDDCPTCRRAAERVGAGGPWPGTTVSPATLPVLPAPRAALHMAVLGALRSRCATPRFDRAGFPMDPKDHAARRERMRARAVTTTVVATVLAAPAIALWASYRGAPAAAETGGSAVAASGSDRPGTVEDRGYPVHENVRDTRTGPAEGTSRSTHTREVSVQVLGPGASPDPVLPSGSAPGRLAVHARSQAGVTLITLTARGGTAVEWTLWSDSVWLKPSQNSGTLEPGESLTIRVTVDPVREPAGDWIARIDIAPGGAVVSVEGQGRPPEPPAPTRPPSTKPSPRPPGPTPTPTSKPPAATPTPSATRPTEPPSEEPQPTPSEGTVPPDPGGP
ncbi:hypothetical protein [Streptomyces sp. NPDC006879]|uniref:BACON domain-containing protein n=1 Tax=Streptomyces sp. NPDC006879 TaxID=3364767 RepID=UPI003698E16A